MEPRIRNKTTTSPTPTPSFSPMYKYYIFRYFYLRTTTTVSTLVNPAAKLCDVHLAVLDEVSKSGGSEAHQNIARLTLEIANQIEVLTQLGLISYFHNLLSQIALFCVYFLSLKGGKLVSLYWEIHQDSHLPILRHAAVVSLFWNLAWGFAQVFNRALKSICDLTKTYSLGCKRKFSQQISLHRDIREHLKTLEAMVHRFENHTLKAMSKSDLKRLLEHFQSERQPEEPSKSSAPIGSPDQCDGKFSLIFSDKDNAAESRASEHTVGQVSSGLSFLEGTNGATFAGNTTMTGSTSTSHVTLHAPNATSFTFYFGVGNPPSAPDHSVQ
ncbi:hypothetical protein CPB83DRAFT_890741 [Crepidotus variabilis]|uniref:Uncharacterized protein n=1 Tax=Crepidotus variabilis TaxID=179855 RepID=A0A9P6EP62_9AGAR|nr:hypothetical protein CPB83DRAFT_890741 [Crepidotus variabilis]